MATPQEFSAAERSAYLEKALPYVDGDDPVALDQLIVKADNAKTVHSVTDQALVVAVASHFKKGSTIDVWYESITRRLHLGLAADPLFPNIDIWDPVVGVQAAEGVQAVQARPGGLKAAIKAAFKYEPQV